MRIWWPPSGRCLGLPGYPGGADELSEARGGVEGPGLRQVEPRLVQVEIRVGGGEQRNETGSNRARSNGELSGHGLLGLRERVALQGGTLHAAAGPDDGSTLRAELPITTDAAQ